MQSTRRNFLRLAGAGAATAAVGVATGSVLGAGRAVAAAPTDVTPIKVSLASYYEASLPGTVGFAAYVRGTTGLVYTRRLGLDGVPLSPWVGLPGQVASGPAALYVGGPSDGGDQLLAARSTGGALVVRIVGVGNGTATAWNSLGGVLTSAPGLGSYQGGSGGRRLIVVVRGTDGGAHVRLRDDAPGAVWSSWRGLGGVFTSALDAFGFAGEFQISGRGTDGFIYTRTLTLTGVPTNGWVNIGVTSTSAVVRAYPFDGPPYLYYRGTGNAVFEKPETAAARSLGGVITSAPTIDTFSEGGDSTSLLAGRGTDGALYVRPAGPGSWRSVGGRVA